MIDIYDTDKDVDTLLGPTPYLAFLIFAESELNISVFVLETERNCLMAVL